ncbi:ATP-binding protein [Streptomyces amakusaensis]|uniref:ATP-binding protein n=1 Tax=Streptomyces amakusaensis TaxID=67271 RepID=A0ABW0ASZ5_9ACTN
MNPQTPTHTVEFTQRFPATRKCAQLARLLAVHALDGWGIAVGTGPSDAAAQIVAELAANAVTHAKVPGREFELRLSRTADTLRIEVSDARAECAPVPRDPSADAESGRGLFLIEALASSWGTKERVVGKTVWADIGLAQVLGQN